MSNQTGETKNLRWFVRFVVVPIVVPVVTAIVGIYVGREWNKHKDKSRPEIGEIKLGFTDHRIDEDITTLENDYQEKIADPANKKLPPDSPFRFRAVVVPGKYSDLLQALHNDDSAIDLAFLSPFNYLYQKYKLKNKYLNGVEIIGMKSNKGNSTYRIVFLFHSDLPINSLDDINSSHISRIVLSTEPTSTSTRVVPRIFFWEKGEVELVSKAMYKDAPDMVKLIRSQGLKEQLLGVLSDEGWQRLCDLRKNEGLRHLKVEDLPIPYDPILTKEKNWTNRFNLIQREIVLDALGTSLEKETEWDKKYKVFIDYVASGVITGVKNASEKQNSKKYIVDFPPSGHDLYDLNDILKDHKPRKVKLFKFKIESAESTDYPLVSELVGTGIVQKTQESSFSNEAVLHIEKELSGIDYHGIHVLLDK